MKFIDAIKSGRPFKRKDDSIWYNPANMYYPICNISIECMDASDWEIEEKMEQFFSIEKDCDRIERGDD